jgi:hypothetical protein
VSVFFKNTAPKTNFVMYRVDIPGETFHHLYRWWKSHHKVLFLDIGKSHVFIASCIISSRVLSLQALCFITPLRA